MSNEGVTLSTKQAQVFLGHLFNIYSESAKNKNKKGIGRETPSHAPYRVVGQTINPVGWLAYHPWGDRPDRFVCGTW